MASYNPTDKQIAEICKRHQKDLKQFMLENVKEVATTNSEDEKGASIGSRMGAYGKVIEMDCDDIPCVGKVLHSVFFDFGTDPSGIKYTLEKFFKEIETLSKMDHNNIVRFMGITNCQDSPLPVLVMEKLECNLTEFLSIHDKGSITEDIALNILLGVAKGLLYLHDVMKVAHRDLSSNNVLLAADLSAKIADLGSARVLDRPGGWNPSTKLSVQPGTLDFMPPEALEVPPKYTVSVDVFSFGCVIVHLDTHIWPSPTPLRKGEDISEIERRLEYISEMVSPYLISMAQKCLQESAMERPSSTVLVELLEEVQKSKL